MMGGAQEFVNRLVPGAVGQAILVLSAIVALGVGLGCLRFRKLGLGSAGVLFAGLGVRQFTQRIRGAAGGLRGGVPVDDGAARFLRPGARTAHVRLTPS
jgi:hypothetical protein